MNDWGCRGRGVRGGASVPERREPIHGGCGRNIPVSHAPGRMPRPEPRVEAPVAFMNVWTLRTPRRWRYAHDLGVACFMCTSMCEICDDHVSCADRPDDGTAFPALGLRVVQSRSGACETGMF